MKARRMPSDAPAFAGTPAAGSLFDRFPSLRALAARLRDRFGNDRRGDSAEPAGGPR